MKRTAVLCSTLILLSVTVVPWQMSSRAQDDEDSWKRISFYGSEAIFSHATVASITAFYKADAVGNISLRFKNTLSNGDTPGDISLSFQRCSLNSRGQVVQCIPRDITLGDLLEKVTVPAAGEDTSHPGIKDLRFLDGPILRAGETFCIRMVHYRESGGEWHECEECYKCGSAR